MRSRERQLRRELGALADRAGLALMLRQTNGGHYRATFMDDESQVSVFMAVTPSDVRSDHNMMARVRRALNQLQGCVR